MSKFIRQPLVHFFALGVVLFVVFGLVNDDAGSDAGEIVVDAARISGLVARFERTWQRPPTSQERAGLIDSWVREEVLYREALALGLDRDDPIVRQRLAQKIEFMFEGDMVVPEESELVAWLQAHPDSYRKSPRYAFEQIFIEPDKHGDELATFVREALAALASGDTSFGGDPTLLPGRVELSSAPEIGRTFGPDFLAGLEAQPVGEWAGPVRSSYGLHLVRIERSEPGYLPPLEDVRTAVERDVAQAWRDRVRAEFLQALVERYDVRIEALPEAASLPEAQ